MVSSLSELSVTAVINSFDAICFKTRHTSDDGGLLSSLDGDFCFLTLPDVFLPPAVADTLLEAVLKHCLYRCPTHLLKWIYPFLDVTKCRLTRVTLPRLHITLPRLHVRGPVSSANLLEFILNQLAHHHLVELNIDPSWCMSLTATTHILSGKNPNISSLKILNLRSVGISADRFAPLADLHQLRSLNLSQTYIRASSVNYLLQNMTNLEVLELAQTPLSLSHLDFSPVAHCLRYLNVQDLNHDWVAPFPFRDLSLLYHLDISKYTVTKWLFDSAPEVSDELIDALISMPLLSSVDLSHRKVYRAQIERLIGSKGSMLKFLGLFKARYLDAFRVDDSNMYPDHVAVTGVSNMKQIVATLRTQQYYILEKYMTPCLQGLFSFLRNGKRSGCDAEITQIVVHLLKIHNDQYVFQLAASGCLSHLFEALYRFDQHCDRRILRSCIDQILLILESPESFSEYQSQLHMNCYIFLLYAEDMICKEKYELERVAKLIVRNLHFYKLENLRVQALRLLRSLSQMLDTEGRTIVGSAGFCQLLKHIVAKKVIWKTDDQELSHVLSAIWNLTDENVPNCHLLVSDSFVDNMLKLFKICSLPATRLKVHGGLGNLLEVPTCRVHLMRDDYCQGFVDMLIEEHTAMEFKFESARAFVNLAMEGEAKWSLSCISYTGALELVEREMKCWNIPSDLQCTYRTFKSQLTLLEQSMVPTVHLFSLWTIANFCYYDDKRYVPMFISDQGVPTVKRILKSGIALMSAQGPPWNCQLLASKILKAVEEFGGCELEGMYM